jgi:hypothetical protein
MSLIKNKESNNETPVTGTTPFMSNLYGTFKQWFVIREFQIHRTIGLAGLQKELLEISKLLEKLGEETGGEPSPTDWAEKLKFLADVATGVWRLRKRMCQPGSDRPREELRREFSHLQSVWDALKQNGFLIQEHTDKKFDTGQSLKVVAFQPTPGLTYEKVIDTIKPSIYYQDRRIQMGEIIVGTPENSASRGSSDSKPAEPSPPGAKLN